MDEIMTIIKVIKDFFENLKRKRKIKKKLKEIRKKDPFIYK